MTPMTRPEFNKKVRTLIKRVASPKNASIKLTKQTREILLYYFYFAIRYEDSIRRSREIDLPDISGQLIKPHSFSRTHLD